MHVEEHAIGGKQDKVRGDGQESRAWVEGGRDRDDGVTGDIVRGKTFREFWGSMGRLVRTLE